MNAEVERPHRRLDVWQRAMAPVARIYDLTKGFPKHEAYGLASQMRRSAVSIPSNIAEGAARKSRAEFPQFLSVAQGSLSEMDTQLELAYMPGYIDDDVHNQTLAEITTVFKMLSVLIRSLKKPEQ